jgi:hypothetical protein
MNTLDVGFLSLGCMVLGVLVSKLWIGATQVAAFQAAIAKAKQDVNNLGINVRNNDRKANRRNQQMVAAQLDIHANDPEAVKRISTLLKDDSWE